MGWTLEAPSSHSTERPFIFFQLISVIQALDRDEAGNSSQVSLQGPAGPDANFTVRDNRGGPPTPTTPMPVSLLPFLYRGPAPPGEPSTQQQGGVHLPIGVLCINLPWGAGPTG